MTVILLHKITTYDLSTEEYVKKFSKHIADPPERVLHDFLI